MTEESKKPIFDLLAKWECPVDWDTGIRDAHAAFEAKIENETEAFGEFLDNQFCDQVKATAGMALDWLFDKDNFGVHCQFTCRSATGEFDGPLSIFVGIGTEGEYERQIPFDDMIAQEIDAHLGHGGSKAEAQEEVIDEILAILAEYERRADWSYEEFLRLKAQRENGQRGRNGS